ncbi:MAG: CoA transferase [Chloroflexi bacterium]|nr:CoA transferase [Chloroflexota bacterium]
MMLLEGIRILDLSQYVLGQYATQIMAEQGADVIRIEQPPRPNMTGQRTNYFREFQNNRNKRSIGVNLKSPEGREVFYRLAKQADVIFEGFRPGVVKRLQVDYDTIRRINPRIVYASLSGYGQDGPYRNLVGHDINYLGVTGFLSLLNDPMPPVNMVGDMAGGSLFSVIGILMALLGRERSGVGQYVDIAMVDGVISMNNWFIRMTDQERDEYRGNPYYYVYPTKDDKHITIGCIEPQFWENLCRALGHEEYIPHQLDMSKRAEIKGAFLKVFRTRTRDEWFELLKQKDICAAPVYSFEEMYKDPQVVSRGMVMDVNDPSAGPAKQLGPGLKFSNAAPREWRAPPRPGENTAAVLTEAGFSPDEISSLRQTGAVS